MTTDTRTGPLAGVTVLELAHVMAGPTCGRMLADLGADVIKLERVPGGDDGRKDTIAALGEDRDSHAFMMMNRNKRGIALDLKTDDGKRVLRKLLGHADVLLENYRHDTMAKLGFSYDNLRSEFPRLIYCAVSGFGRSGPYRERGGFDLVAQGMSGLMGITGEGVGHPPVKVGAPVTDITAGILASLGIVSALYSRENTGRGQFVDTSLFEAGVVFSYWHAAICFATGYAPGALGSAHPLHAPYQAYQTNDGWITIGGANQANWLRLVDILKADELKNDDRFKDNSGRMTHLYELNELLSKCFSTRSTSEWLVELEKAGVPAGPILSIKDMLSDPQAIAREMVTETVHPKHGKVKTIGCPVKFSDTPASVTRPAPLYGQHTREVLREFGLSETDVERLVKDGVAVTNGS